MKTLLVFALLITNGVAWAEVDIEKDSFNVAYQIQNEGKFLTSEQRTQILNHLTAIHGVFVGRTDTLNLNCVARDNDGRAPWVLAIRQGINVNRLTNAVFGSKEQCQQSLTGARSFGDAKLACVTRDSDARDPWQVAAAVVGQSNPTAVHIPHMLASNLENCLTLINGLKAEQNIVTFCNSRDDDNRGPFSAYALDLGKLSVEASNSQYPTMEACQEFLGK